MKILHSLVSSFVFVGAALSVQAQDVYVCGAFNDYNPGDNSEYKLISGDPEDGLENEFSIYELEIPEGQFTLNFKCGDVYLVPGESDESIKFEDSNTYNTTFVEGAETFWVNDTWEGGKINILLNIADGTVIFQEEVEIADLWYIRGIFNDFNPDGEEKWALNPSENEDENGVYYGEFEVPQYQLSFNLLAPNGMVYIPATLTTETFVFTDNVYSGHLDYAYDETEATYCWVKEDWNGGKISVTVDSNTGLVVFRDLSQNAAISSISIENNGNELYNLQGVKVNTDAKGILIRNGKKVLVK